MKHSLSLFSLLVILCVSGLATAKESRYLGLTAAADWSQPAPNANTPRKFGYQNIQDSSRWSRLQVGKALTANLSKRAHANRLEPFDKNILFAPGGGGAIGCGWTCCFKSCMYSVLDNGVENTCLASCLGCGLAGGIWPCAVCVGCGAVGIAALEFCALHCCVEPGC